MKHVMKPDNVTVFSFPIKAPENSVYRTDLSAEEQLDLWLKYQYHWCEHKPSVTISVKEEEWVGVGAWVWNHLDSISGFHSYHLVITLIGKPHIRIVRRRSTRKWFPDCRKKSIGLNLQTMKLKTKHPAHKLLRVR